jgi:hypothetical protein
MSALPLDVYVERRDEPSTLPTYTSGRSWSHCITRTPSFNIHHRAVFFTEMFPNIFVQASSSL